MTQNGPDFSKIVQERVLWEKSPTGVDKAKMSSTGNKEHAGFDSAEFGCMYGIQRRSQKGMRYSELVSYHEWFKITEGDDQSSEIKSFAQMSLPYTPVQVNEGEKEKIYLSIYYIKGTT